MPSTISLEVDTPCGTFHGEFTGGTPLKKVIEEVAKQQELEPGDLLELACDETILTPDSSPIDSFGILPASKLELVATGVGA